MSEIETFGSAIWNGTDARFGYGICSNCFGDWFWVNNGTDAICCDCCCYGDGGNAGSVAITETAGMMHVKIETVSGDTFDVDLTHVVQN